MWGKLILDDPFILKAVLYWGWDDFYNMQSHVQLPVNIKWVFPTKIPVRVLFASCDL